MLKYNIDFEIMGLLITLVVAVAFRMTYAAGTKSDKAFMNLIHFILVAQILDMATAITFSFEIPELNLVNMIMTMGYYFCAFLTAVCFERYIISYFPEGKKNRVYEFARKVLIVLYCGSGLLNPLTKWHFYFDADGSYVHGPLYLTGYLVPGVFALASLYQIIRHRKYFSKKQWISCVSFLGVVFLAMVLQARFFPNIYLTYGLVPVALLIVMLSFETPDYRKLMQTMDELEEAKQEAWRANRVKSDFLANMSHEIRTPINSVLGFDEMILRESTEPDIISYAKNIKNSGQTLLSLVNDILDLSKIEAGKMEIINAEYDFAATLSGLIKMITPRAKEKGLRIHYEIDGRIPRKLIGDDVRISQVLTNLMTNAVKYTPKGDVTLEVKLQEMEEGEARIFFAVRDTGTGIREEDKEKLFSEFGRLEGERNHKIEGTGLGLPITMKCLLLMGSMLELQSVYGEGSVFYFELKQEIADKTPIGDFEKVQRTGLNEVTVFQEDFTAPDAHILVVDDVELNLKVFQGLLKKSKLNIDTAASGQEAIEKMRANSYDCVFMDHQMPEMNGIETLEKLREDASIKMDDIPVIALTANAIAGAREMYLQNGFSDYLTKPIDGKLLLAMLHRWLPAEKIQLMSSGEDSPKKEESVMDRLRGAGFDVDAGLSYLVEEQLYLELLGDFAKDAGESARILQNFFQEKDWKNYRVKVHSLKGTAKTIGAADLSEEAKELEFAARDGDEALLEKKHGNLMEHYRRTAEKISQILGNA